MESQQIEKWVDSAMSQGYMLGCVVVQGKLAKVCARLLKEGSLPPAAWSELSKIISEPPDMSSLSPSPR